MTMILCFILCIVAYPNEIEEQRGMFDSKCRNGEDLRLKNGDNEVLSVLYVTPSSSPCQEREKDL